MVKVESSLQLDSLGMARRVAHAISAFVGGVVVVGQKLGGASSRQF